MRSRVRIAAVFLFALSAVIATPLGAGASHSWGGYHWARTGNPFTLAVGDNVSPAWDPYLGQASVDWSKSTVLDTTVVVGSANPRNCKPTAGRVQVCSSSYGNNGWLGLAQIWISSSHITQGAVKLNDYYYAMAKYNTAAWRQMVVCQEVGHTFGLDHQDENQNNDNLGTCMDYTSDPTGATRGGKANTAPNQHDYDELITIYTHLDSSSTVGTLSSPSARATEDVPGEWGRLVAGSEDPHGVAVYDRDLGNEQHVVTFVVWAE
jgi:hypothetical protein